MDLARCKRAPVGGLGGMVRRHREALSLLVVEYAEKVGIVPSSLGKIEQQEWPNTTLHVLDKLAKVLGMTTPEMLGAALALRQKTPDRAKADA